ncbi:MAG: hypothetical protein HY815_07040 [Candidatus Riflebacteria bacterium]|nr:hypothetical protein [Candidatus Riflebacteria bacterium]
MKNEPVATILRFLVPALVLALTLVPPVAALAQGDPADLPGEIPDFGGASLHNVQQREAAAERPPGDDPGATAEGARPAARAPSLAYEVENDIAVVPFRNIASKERAGLIYSKTQDFFRKKGFSVAPRPRVDRAVKKLGVLNTEAITVQDCEGMAAGLKVRYLIFGTARLVRADTNFSPVGAIVSGARVLVGGFSSAAAVAGLPFLVGGLAFSLVAGFSLAANADLECRIYDAAQRKVIWVGSESAQQRKTFMAVFANKKKVEMQALERGISKLFDPIASKLAIARRRGPSVD